jgi:hypothetical protein
MIYDTKRTFLELLNLILFQLFSQFNFWNATDLKL